MGGSRNRFSQIGEAGQQRWRVRQNSVIITGPRTVVGSAALLPTNHPGRPTDQYGCHLSLKCKKEESGCCEWQDGVARLPGGLV